MAIIHESKNFIIESREEPFISREEGGHIRIRVKDKSITDRTKLNSEQAIELMKLTIITGDSLEKGMNKQGIQVVKVNYQDNGNWAFKKNESPYLHIHIFGRSKNAKKQVFPEAVYLPKRESGFYNEFKPLNKQDVKIIKELIETSLQSKKFSGSKWNSAY